MRLFPPSPYGLAEDYRVFYGAAHVVGAGANPYSQPVIRAAEQAAQHYRHLQPALDTFVNPPFVAWMLVPLAAVPFWVSYGLFTLCGLLALGVAVPPLARDLGWRHWPALLAAVVLGWIGLLGFVSGQFDAALTAALAGAMVLAWRGRGGWAGLVLTAIWIKPELLWPAPIFLVVALWPERRGALRAGWGFGAGTSVLWLIQAAVAPQLLFAWWAQLRDFAGQVAQVQPDLSGLPGLLGAVPQAWHLGRGLHGPATVALVGLGLVAMAVFGWWMARGRDWARVTRVGRVGWGLALPVGLWLLVAPYAHPNDDLLLVPLLLLTVGRDARRVHGFGLIGSVAILVLFGLVWPLGLIPAVAAVPLAVAVAAILWWRRTDPRLTGLGTGLAVLALATLPVVYQFHTLPVGLTSLAVLVLCVEGARTVWIEVGGAGTGPAYAAAAAGPGGAVPAGA